MHNFNLSHIQKVIENELGLPIIYIIIIGCIGAFIGVLILESWEGRGRRYRRGYSVAYREQLGKERAKMRARQEEAGEKKRGWREK